MIILKRMYYSEPEQREYNIISDLYHSGAKRTYKKHVGKIKKKIETKLIKSARNQRSKADEDAKKVLELEKSLPENEELSSKLKEEASKRKVGIIDKNLYHSMFEINGGAREDAMHNVSKEIKDAVREEMSAPNFQYAPPNRKMVYNKMLENDAIINLKSPESKGYLSIAHELGHDLNKDSNFIAKRIHNKAKDYYNSSPNDNVRKRIAGRLITVREELNADKNARKLLKKQNVPEEIIDNYNKIRKSAIDNYKHSRNTEILKGIAKKFHIKRKNGLQEIDNI